MTAEKLRSMFPEEYLTKIKGDHTPVVLRNGQCIGIVVCRHEMWAAYAADGVLISAHLNEAEAVDEVHRFRRERRMFAKFAQL